MKRRITILITFLLTLTCVDLLIRRSDDQLARYYMSRFERKLAKLQDNDPPPEALLFGSSRATHGFAPEEFRKATGLKTYNFAIAASKITEWRIALRESLKIVKDPRLIVVGINASAIRANYIPAMAARDMFSPGDFIEYTMTDGWSNEVASHYIDRQVLGLWATWHRSYELKLYSQEVLGPVFPKHAQLARERRALVSLELPMDGFEHPWMRKDRMMHLADQIKNFGDDHVWRSGVPAYSPNAKAIGQLEKFLYELKATNAALLICYIPNAPRAERQWAVVEPQMKRIIAETCARCGVAFLDSPIDELPRTDADYVVETHTGLELAQALSRRAGQYVMKVGMLDRPTRAVAITDVGGADLP